MNKRAGVIVIAVLVCAFIAAGIALMQSGSGGAKPVIAADLSVAPTFSGGHYQLTSIALDYTLDSAS